MILRRLDNMKSYSLNKFKLKYKRVKMGQKVKINGVIKIYGPSGRISIGNNCTINSDIRFNPIGGQSGCYFNIMKDGKIILEDGAGISNTTICSMTEVSIGRNVYIGGNCRIYDTDFHSLFPEQRLSIPDTHIKTKAIRIDDNAFIGGSSIILKGVHIGKNCIVGAGSVVTRDIPDNQIWGGNPARFLKMLE